MIDLAVIRADPQAFAAAIKRKNVNVDLEMILKLDQDYRSALQKVELLRRTQNEANQKISAAKKPAEKSEFIGEMKKVASEVKRLENLLVELKQNLEERLLSIPNPPHSSVPDGGEADFTIVRTVGEVRDFDFKPKNHEELGEALDLIDTKRGAKVSGSRFYYLKNDAVLLEFALVNYALEILLKKGFTPLTTPTLVREQAMISTGFFPSEKVNIYSVNPSTENNPEGDDLFLVGTSEVPLTMYHADEILTGKFPKRYVGWSTCYRREAGSYGKDTKGIFRVHQFDKLEMFSFCEPGGSWDEHDFLLSCQEEILKGLGLPYRVINIAAGDLGAPAAKKYDCEVWIPSQTQYRELTSTSNCTDFQARRANIRYRTTTGNQFIHTLNGTAFASTRLIIAILENFQNSDGSVSIPVELQKWMGKDRIQGSGVRGQGSV